MGRHDDREGAKPFSEQLGLFYAAPLSLIPLLVIFSLAFARAFFVAPQWGLLAGPASLVIYVVGLRYALKLLRRFSQGHFDLGAVVADEEHNPYTVYKVIGALFVTGLVLALLAGAMPPLAWVFFPGLFVVCSPLVVMLITLHDRLEAGLNVGKWLHMVSVIGGSYGWLLAMSFLVTMGSGVVADTLQGLLGKGFVARLGTSLISHYAMFVVFCMMGYVLFEKADHFDIETQAARRARLVPGQARGPASRESAQDLLSRGDVEGALELAAEEARLGVNDARAQERYFKLLQMRGGDEPKLQWQALRWLLACAGSNRADDCARLVRQWWVPHPTLLDEHPQALLDAARLAGQGGAPQEALLMLRHFQKTQRGSMLMPQAVLLEADVLFSRLREPQLAKARLQELVRVYPNSQAQIQEATAMLNVIEAVEKRPAPGAPPGAGPRKA